jgi:hypothetical protein
MKHLRPNKIVNWIISETAEATGISITLVSKIHYDSAQGPLTSTKKKQKLKFLNLHSAGVESKLGPLGTSATYWPLVPAPGDCEDGEFGGMNGNGKPKYSEKTCPDTTLSTTNPT